MLALAACTDQQPTTPGGPGIAVGKSGTAATSSDPTVKSVDPDSATRDTTLDIAVSGSGFSQGSRVDLGRSGVPSDQIRTNSTTFVNSRTLIANITVSATADTGKYDVIVTALDGRKGIGVEMFTVKVPNLNVATLELSGWTGALWGPASGVYGGFTSDGRLMVNTEGGKGKNAATRVELCLDLSHLGGDGIVDRSLYDLFVQQVATDATSNGMSSACTVVTMHTRTHSNPEAMSGQAVGAIEYAGGKIVLKDYDTGVGGNGGWEWRLIWDAPDPVYDPSATDYGQGICISRPEVLTWYVYNDDGNGTLSCQARGVAVDNVAELWRVANNAFFHVAEFTFPFRFRVTVVTR